MAQVKLLKINSSGLQEEMDTAADDITLNTYTAGTSFDVTSGVSITSDITFNAVTDTIAGIQNQNLLDKTADESITGEYDINAGQFVLPLQANGSPAEGDVYWDGSSDKLFVYDGSAYVDVGASGSADSVIVSYNAGTSGVTQYDAVYISGADAVDPTDADAIATSEFIGFALTTETVGNPVNVQIAGVVGSALVGATAGQRYFLDTATPGNIVTSAPSGSGDVVYVVGYAKNATDLHIQPTFVGIRS